MNRRMDVNDNSDYQLCFACGKQNPHGLKMEFRIEGETVVCDFMPSAEHQGFPGVLHGGIVATVLDEGLNRTSLLAEQPCWTMTGRLEVRYRRAVPYGPLLRVRAALGRQRGRMLQASGRLMLAEDESVIFADAQGSFMALSTEVLDSIMKDYPGMRSFLEGENENEGEGVKVGSMLLEDE
ncbi:PaaI family thioesterase [Ktedonobacteria bacterium brp13]|nr:PaaI family thioesterase [Ktedonobacteria bacterium brp13]